MAFNGFDAETSHHRYNQAGKYSQSGQRASGVPYPAPPAKPVARTGYNVSK